MESEAPSLEQAREAGARTSARAPAAAGPARQSLHLVAALHGIRGALLVLLVLLLVGVHAAEGAGSFDAALREMGLAPAWGAVLLAALLGLAWADLAACRWLARARPRGRIVASVVAVVWLSEGLADVARADLDVLGAVVGFAVPLLTLHVVWRRHGRAFDR